MKTSRFIGIDVGAETVKLVEIAKDGQSLKLVRREMMEHQKDPGPVLARMLESWEWEGINGVAASGRFAGRLDLSHVPQKQAQVRGYRFLFGNGPATVINIGAQGFSVLELRPSGQSVFRENSRCSQGTGNFLRQLIERFSLTVEQAGELCADVSDPLPLSGRCPVILKTDMTHLANRGEARIRILAGLFDAVCENVLTLVKPGVSPARVILTGGVGRSPRVRRVLGQRLGELGLRLAPSDIDDIQYLQAIGSALIASEISRQRPALRQLWLPAREVKSERLPPLSHSLCRIRRMPPVPWFKLNGDPRRLVLGFDVGSTGSKAVAIDLLARKTVWEGYRQTLGEPVAAAQHLLKQFTQSFSGEYPVVAFGATGSGREIVGSLLASCYGRKSVYVVNEIVAHAAGALSYDPRVDTIFEIGGQDAKYVRLAEGRVIDCAMNEACSAGTGSFIEEQGRKFADSPGPEQLGRTALGASAGVSLGQHCSVFMAEVIDEAVASGVEVPAIISGLYDSIIKNYLNRVKGNRSVGKVIFCQGMPFAADALAAAVARQTGCEVVVPPNPGTVGALGVALLAAAQLDTGELSAACPELFFEARVQGKDTFVCGATRGCGGAGNRCRIERLRTVVNHRASTFTWGGGCVLHDQASRKRKLPDLAPDPFRQREQLRHDLVARLKPWPGARRVALSDEFMLNGLFPFFAVFLNQLGLNVELVRGASQETLKRGIQAANAPFCAPMQLFHGVAQQLAATAADFLFVPMLRGTPRIAGQRCAVTCPIVQSAAKVVAGAFLDRPGHAQKLISPVIDFDQNGLESKAFFQSCEGLVRTLGLAGRSWVGAWHAAVAAQRSDVIASESIGQTALDYCRTHGVLPVVVLGRDYTIHNRVLNANLPAILREQGTVAIPADCFPIQANVPVFKDVYWGYGQNLLRAAHQVRRTRGVYGLYCSNYSCGPDSFNLHFANYIMAGKPFAIIETDGHSGDAGTKTRVEAFLHCAEEHARTIADAVPNSFEEVQFSGEVLFKGSNPGSSGERLLVPFFGPASEVVTAIFKGLGWDAEMLPAPNAQSLKRGRRHTSGKECLPVPLTLGGLLQRLDHAQTGERFVYVMPCTDGPCRFGAYNLLNQIVLKELGWADRVRIWSPKDTGYFDGVPASTEMLVLTGLLACDLLLQARLDLRPLERTPGEVDGLYEQCHRELLDLMKAAAGRKLKLGSALWNVVRGDLFGVAKWLRRCAEKFRALRVEGELPTVELAGEIYVRTVDASNDFLIKKLEQRGLRVYLAPGCEWINYCSEIQALQPGRNQLVDGFSAGVRHRIEKAAFSAFGSVMGWGAPPAPKTLGEIAAPYVDPGLHGEAILTVGGPLYEWRRGFIHGLVNVGPLECMPSKIAEAQLQLVAEREGLPSLTLAFNGEPVSTTMLDDFAFEVKQRFERSRSAHHNTNDALSN